MIMGLLPLYHPLSSFILVYNKLESSTQSITRDYGQSPEFKEKYGQSLFDYSSHVDRL